MKTKRVLALVLAILSGPAFLLVRLRHPQQKPLQSVIVNGEAWSYFDPKKEWVRIPNPTGSRYHITARY
jgi:hypothetical protein